MRIGDYQAIRIADAFCHQKKEAPNPSPDLETPRRTWRFHGGRKDYDNPRRTVSSRSEYHIGYPTTCRPSVGGA
jgi:hypothetical protein